MTLFFIFRERGREGEREGEKHRCIDGCLSHTLNCGPGLQPRHANADWELNQQPCDSHIGAQSTEPHQSG